VVAYQQRAARHARRVFDPGLHAEDFQQPASPGHDDAVELRRLEQRQRQPGQHHPQKDVQRQQAEANGTAEGDGRAGKLHPRIVMGG